MAKKRSFPHKDLTGNQYGCMRVIGFVGYKSVTKYRKPIWSVRCTKCRAEKTIHGGYLKSRRYAGECISCAVPTPRKDLAGKRYGIMRVVRFAEYKQNSRGYRPYWVMGCTQCGAEKTQDGTYVVRKDYSGRCGKCDKSILHHTTTDLTGRKFGRLTVLDFDKYDLRPTKDDANRRMPMWKTRCRCGTEKSICGQALLAGRTKSCGCLLYTKAWRRKIAFRRNPPPEEVAVTSIINHYKHSAKRRGLDFCLDRALMLKIIKQNCHYCGVKPYKPVRSMFNNTYKKVAFLYNGIDRINSGLGYVVGNVLPCCETCNRAKLAQSYEEFIRWINRLTRFRRRTNDSNRRRWSAA